MKTGFLSALLLLMFLAMNAQEPVIWSYSTKKIAANTYELHIAATIRKGWHIYSQENPQNAGQPTIIKFAKNPLVTAVGGLKEKGTLQRKYEAVFETVVNYYEGRIDYTQLVKVKANVKTVVSGAVTYMACTDKECLPPATQKFDISIQ